VDLLGPCGAFTEPCRPLTFHCHPQAHPSRYPRPPDVLSVITLLADGEAELNLRARGPCFALPVRARRAKARKRLPSSREPASFHPQAMRSGTCWVPAHTRTVSPSAHPRSASVELRTSSWLAPSRGHQQVLRPPGGEDARCVQPMSATQTNCVHPHLARSRLALATFAAWTPHGD
jgi:hypothetical protein